MANILRRSFPLSILLVLFVFSLYGQKANTITIEGNTTFAPGEEVRLSGFTDLISFKPQIFATATTDQNGSFLLTFNSNQIEYVGIEIRTSKAQFFVVPGYHYSFDIDMDPELFNLLDPEEYGGFLQIRSKKIDTLDLNYKINRFSTYLNKLLEANVYDILRSKNRQVYDSLILQIQDHFEIRYEPDNFYLSYIYYSIGNMDMMFYSKDKELLYRRYLDNDYILYDNPVYMAFFNDFYQNYLYTSPRISKTILSQYINEAPSYFSLFNEVGKDRFLVNERIRELVIIRNLADFYRSDEFVKENILFLLNDIKKNTHFPAHKPIIENVLYMITRYDAGKIIPEISLTKANGEIFRLEELNGKWVYLHFFNTLCLDCIREMMIIKELQKKYADDIVFVSISIDHDFNTFKNFTKSYAAFDWPILHFSQSYQWLKEMGINSLPDNILLDPAGKISNRYPPDPAVGLSRFLLQKFTKEEEENSIFGE